MGNTSFVTDSIEFFKKFSKEFEDSAIAGGFVRDILLGVPPRDLDIACLADPDDIVSYLVNSKLGNNGLSIREYKEGPKFTLIKVYQIDVMIHEDKDISTILREFDYGICQAALLPNGDFLLTPQFIDDWSKKTITEYNPPNLDVMYSGETDHLERLVKKLGPLGFKEVR